LRYDFQFLHLVELAAGHFQHHVEHRLLPVFAYLYQLHAAQSILTSTGEHPPFVAAVLPHPSDKSGFVRRASPVVEYWYHHWKWREISALRRFLG